MINFFSMIFIIAFLLLYSFYSFALLRTNILVSNSWNKSISTYSANFKFIFHDDSIIT